MEHGHLITAGQSLDVALLFGTGLAMSVGHCLGMCGPLVGSLAAWQRTQDVRGARLVWAQTLHHVGRLSAYAVIGFAFALAGTVLRESTAVRGVQGGLSLAMGLVMIGLGFGLLGWLPRPRLLQGAGLPQALGGTIARGRLGAGTPAWYLLGLANGFLPCGPVYAVAAGAVTADPVSGALAMLLFGLGTLPVLMLWTAGASRIGPGLRSGFSRLAGGLVVVLGIQLACRGAAVLGWIGHLRLGPLVLW